MTTVTPLRRPFTGAFPTRKGRANSGVISAITRAPDLWDDTGALAAGNAPILFVNSDTDTHFTLDSTARCIRAAKYGAATVIPGLTHGHAQGAEVREVVRLCRRNLFEKDAARPRSDLPRKRRDRDRRARKRKGFRGCTALYSFGNRRFVDRVGGRKSHAKRRIRIRFRRKIQTALLYPSSRQPRFICGERSRLKKQDRGAAHLPPRFSYYYNKTLIT